MRVFVSAGEPSGDLHGANLARALRRLNPSTQIVGLGGAQMREAGVELLYPLAEHAVMGFVRVVGVIPQLADLLDRVTADWQRRRPDAVVLIDYPGYHWWVAARAKAMEIPVVSFVPPQIWAWASHRVAKVRAYFDEVLCSLPFEPEWFKERGVPQARYVGHPYFDELARQRLDRAFISDPQSRGRFVAMLPGSRGHEVAHNLPTMLGAARKIQDARPDARFVFACYREEHRRRVDARIVGNGLNAESHVGLTPEIIAAAEACIAVSGSVSLELLYHCTPTVVLYRTTRFYKFLTQLCKNVPYISLVNLLAGRELFPEFLLDRDEPGPMADVILAWLNDEDRRSELIGQLQRLKHDVAAPGACDRAAEILLERFGRRTYAAA